MGLLDDAIREHLDLKRRRGADPAEIERAEREALGPVRRAPEPQETSEPDLSAEMPYDDQAGHVAEHDDGLEWDNAYEDDAGEFEPFDHRSDSQLTADSELHEPPPPRATPPPEEAPTQHMALPDHEIEDEFEPGAGTAVPPPHPAAPPPEDAAPRAPHQPADHVGDETVEYEVEAEFAEGEKAHEDDVLEETPEFLQDTPDHDRLWFEQRPPRDFDFDD